MLIGNLRISVLDEELIQQSYEEFLVKAEYFAYQGLTPQSYLMSRMIAFSVPALDLDG
jgi:hypothetical protein